MFKRILSIICSVAIMLSNVPIESMSFASDKMQIIQNSTAYAGISDDPKTLYFMVENNQISIADIEYYLTNVLGKSLISRKGKYDLNPHVYAKYKVIAYTSENAINSRATGMTSKGEQKETYEGQNKIIEYRYLGYDYYENSLITNDFFPADAKTAEDPRNKQYIKSLDNAKSWSESGGNNNMIKKLFYEDLLNEDAPSYKLSLDDLISSTSDLETLKQYAERLQWPSFSDPAMLKVRHKVNGVTWYDTMRQAPFSFEFKAPLTVDEKNIFITADVNSVSIPYTVTPQVLDLKTDNRSLSSRYFKEISVKTLDGEDTPIFENPTFSNIDLPNLATSYTKVIDTSNLEIGVPREVKLTSLSTIKGINGYEDTDPGETIVTIIKTANDYVDFSISRNGSDVTDSSIMMKNLLFNKPVTLEFSDESSVVSGEVSHHVYEYEYNGDWKELGRSANGNVSFVIKSSNRNILNNGNLKVRKTIFKTDGSKVDSIPIHYTLFLEQALISGDVVAVMTSTAKYNYRNDLYTVMEGDSIYHKGNKSYHNADKEIRRYDFDASDGNGRILDTSKKRIKLFYPSAGDYEASLTVTDEDGASDTDEIDIKVIPARFEPEIKVTGTLKENRKVSFNVKNGVGRLENYPIDQDTLSWTISPLDGQKNSYNIDGSKSGDDDIDTLFSKKGRYKIKVSGYIHSSYNTNRYYGESEKVITIKEDLPPIADVSVTQYMLRDPWNDNMTGIRVTSRSESIDGDYINQHIIVMRYDSDNDKRFDDETPVYLSSTNSYYTEYKTKDVGRYQFDVIAVEEFGQSTIDKFVSPSDRRRDDTDDIPSEEKTTLIGNVPPTVDIEASQKKEINLIVYNDFNESEKLNFISRFNELKGDLLGKKINVKEHYLNPTVTSGNREAYTTYFDTFISVTLSVKGERSYQSHTGGSNSFDIDELQTFNLYLDSFSSEGSAYDFRHPNKNRFQIVDVSFGDSGRKYYEYKDRSYDYSEFYYRELNITYKDYGVQKKATYNFVYNWENYSKYDGKTRYKKANYPDYKITGYGLHEDEAFIERPKYIQLNNEFGYGYSPKPTINKPTNTKRDVNLKTYLKSELDSIVQACGESDTYFLNLCSDTSNRLLLNEELTATLKNNNIPYLTLDSGLIGTNPLSGNFDKLIIGSNVDIEWNSHADRYEDTVKRVFVTIGDLLYELDQESKRYIFMGLTENAEAYRDNSSDMVKASDSNNVYVQGYRFEGNLYYGLEALNKKLISENRRYIDVWRRFNEFEDAYEAGTTAGGKWDFVNNWINESIYNDHCGKLTLMPDGNLVGYKLFMDNYYPNQPDGEFIKEAVIYGSGYVGKVELEGFVDGFVHSNGKVFFKKGNGSFYYKHSNVLVVTEGINNIRYMKYSAAHNALYVYTDTSLVKYDTIDKSRNVINDSIIERKGTSIKIGDNKWMIGEKIYEGYKEIYTTDLDGEYFNYTYRRKGEDLTGRMKYSLKLYIDETDNLYQEIYRYDPPRYTGMFKKLIATNVKSLPFMSGMNQLPGPNHVLTDKKLYHCMSYLDNEDYLYSKDNVRLINTPIEEIMFIGRATDNFVTSAENTYYTSLISLKDGRLGLHASNKATYLKNIEFANLTTGSKDKLISDSDLISTHPSNVVYSSLSYLMNAIYNNYRNYSTSSTLTILKGDRLKVETTMIDYESDPAYAMLVDTEHVNPNYYENSLGKDPNIGTAICLDQLNYVGHYVMKARVRDNPVGDDDRFDDFRLWNKDDTKLNIYVHRRPVAKMSYVLSEKGDGYTLTAWDKGSYDLDHESEVNNGIVAWQWSVKEKSETAWTQYHTPKINYDKIESDTTYDLILRVKDREGVWSKPLHRKINPEIIPIEVDARVTTADDRFSLDGLPVTEDYELADMVTRYPTQVKLSYGLYDGGTLLTTLETLTQDEGVTGYFATEEDRKIGQFTWYKRTLKVPKNLADGAYIIRIEATDVNNAAKSATCLLEVGVKTPINLLPSVGDLWMAGESYEISCRTSIYTDEVVASIFNGSPKEKAINMVLDEIISEDIGGQIKQIEKVWKATCLVPEDLLDSMYNVVFTGRVLTTPSKSEHATRSLQVISLNFDEVVLSGAWNHWRGQIDLFGKQMDDMPLRFLSWEKLYFTVKTLGNPENVYITMSPELEAMSFIDKNGTAFNYKDSFGYEVTFPLALKKIEDNIWTGEYILPLAHSSLSWEDRRLKPPYEIIVTAMKNGKKVTYGFTEKEGRGIEITGNVTNLIYEQPMPDRSR